MVFNLTYQRTEIDKLDDAGIDGEYIALQNKEDRLQNNQDLEYTPKTFFQKTFG